MAGCGLFRAGRELAKVPLTGRNRASVEVVDFLESGFSSRAGVGFLPPAESGEFVKPKCKRPRAHAHVDLAGLKVSSSTGIAASDTENDESPDAADRAGASAVCHHRQMKTHGSYAHMQAGASA
jgi:hypothetical protein